MNCVLLLLVNSDYQWFSWSASLPQFPINIFIALILLF